MPCRPDMQDLSYVANLGIKLPHLKFDDDSMVVSNFKSPVRRSETKLGIEQFKLMGYEPVVAPRYFEGEADLKWINSNVYAGGYGVRTSMNALKWFEREFNMVVIPIESTNELYHLDCTIFPMTPKLSIVVEGAVPISTLRQLEKHTEIIMAPSRLGPNGITNNTRIDHLVMVSTIIDTLKRGDDDFPIESEKLTWLEHTCAKYGFEPVTFNTSEFHKSGAAMSCMIMHLNYVDFMKDAM